MTTPDVSSATAASAAVSTDINVAAPAASTTPTAASSSSGSGSGTNTNSTFSSMSQLQEKSPEVYNAMLLGIAQTICGKMADSQKRVKEINREGRAANG